MFDAMTQNRQFWSSEALWLSLDGCRSFSSPLRAPKVLFFSHTEGDSHQESTAMPIYAPTMQVTNETLTPGGPVPVDYRAQNMLMVIPHAGVCVQGQTINMWM